MHCLKIVTLDIAYLICSFTYIVYFIDAVNLLILVFQANMGKFETLREKWQMCWGNMALIQVSY